LVRDLGAGAQTVNDMTSTRGLDAVGSAFLTDELYCRLGGERTADILGVSLSRLDSIRQERGRLTDRQLDRISAITGKPWTLWALDAGDRAAREGRDPQGIAQHNHILRDTYNSSASDEVDRAKARLSRSARAAPPRTRAAARRPKPAA
jgi:hypothetical protein